MPGDIVFDQPFGSVSGVRGSSPTFPPRYDDAQEAAAPVATAYATADLDELLRALVDKGGSDLHLTVGIGPCVRVDGQLSPLQGYAKLLPPDTERLVRSFLTGEQWEKFDRTNELDISYAIAQVSRFRVNVFRQRGSIGATFRAIPHTIKSLTELGVPAVVEHFAQLSRGLVLVTGPTGSGKSTTLASLVDVANRTRSGHIMTIEDPIEYLHRHGRCIVNQREIGNDTEDFPTALKHVLRQDPDIILVGELRDLETTSVAITAAETGHLVFATLHTKSAAQTVDRLVDIYPHEQQQQIRSQLANALEGVVTQALVPRRSGGRAVACEIMVSTPAIRSLIREDKVHLIPGYVQSGSDVGMMSFDQNLAELYRQQIIGRQAALDMAQDVEEFRQLAGLA